MKRSGAGPAAMIASSAAPSLAGDHLVPGEPEIIDEHVAYVLLVVDDRNARHDAEASSDPATIETKPPALGNRLKQRTGRLRVESPRLTGAAGGPQTAAGPPGG